MNELTKGLIKNYAEEIRRDLIEGSGRVVSIFGERIQPSDLLENPDLVLFLAVSKAEQKLRLEHARELGLV